MEQLKAICRKLLYPPKWLMILLLPISLILLAAVFVKSWTEKPAAYISYVLSAYTLTVVCIYFSGIIPDFYMSMKQKIYEHPLGNQYMTDTAFKVRISLFTSLMVNVGYSVFKVIPHK